MSTWWENFLVLSFSPGYVMGWHVGDVCSLQTQLSHLKSAVLGNIEEIIQNVPLQNNAKCSMLLVGSKYRNTSKSEKTDLWRFFTQLRKDISNLKKNHDSWDQIRWLPDWWRKYFKLLAIISISTWFGTNIRLSSWRLMWETLKRENL